MLAFHRSDRQERLTRPNLACLSRPDTKTASTAADLTCRSCLQGNTVELRPLDASLTLWQSTLVSPQVHVFLVGKPGSITDASVRFGKVQRYNMFMWGWYSSVPLQRRLYTLLACSNQVREPIARLENGQLR